MRVVYVSASLSLATLEYLVHANALSAPRNVYSVWAEIPDDIARESLTEARLAKSWRRYEPPVEKLREMGDRWVRAARTAILEVPSAVVPSENNFLLNPAHPDFQRITQGKPAPANFDVRLSRI